MALKASSPWSRIRTKVRSSPLATDFDFIEHSRNKSANSRRHARGTSKSAPAIDAAGASPGISAAPGKRAAKSPGLRLTTANVPNHPLLGDGVPSELSCDADVGLRSNHRR